VRDLEAGVADDGADPDNALQSPKTAIAVAKCSIDVGTPDNGDSPAVGIGNLAAELGVDCGPKRELNGLDGAEAGVEGASLAVTVVDEDELGAELDGLILEDDADLLVGLARRNLLGSWSSHGGGGGQSGEEDARELHFDWWVGWVLLMEDSEEDVVEVEEVGS
jgi:hypothetical protein